MEKSNPKDKQKDSKETISSVKDPKLQKPGSKGSIFSSLKSKGGSLWKDIRKIYKFGKVIGGGNFGSVRMAYKKGGDKKNMLAIKSISKKNLSEEDLANLIKEVEIISELDHANIIDFKETYQDSLYFHIVMELCTGKELFDKLVEEGKITENRVATIIYKLCKAILYCHNVGIIHRDIKAENIIFDDDSENSEIKIIDFGLSKKYSPNEKMKSVLGTPYYVAPEVLKGSYDAKCDVWSIGVLAYILLSGTPPFKGKTDFDIFNSIIKEDFAFDPKKFKGVTDEAKDFIRICLNKDPVERPSSKKIMEHKWFKKIKEDTFRGDKLDVNILKNLQNFSAPTKFKKIALAFMVNLFSVEETKKLRNVFEAMDLNEEGFINIEELKTAYKKAGVNLEPGQVEKVLENVDITENGRIDYTEFLVAAVDWRTVFNKSRIQEAFNYLDIDHSGFITSENIKSAFLRAGKQILNPEELEEVMAEVNKVEKKVNIEEFINMFDLDK